MPVPPHRPHSGNISPKKSISDSSPVPSHALHRASPVSSHAGQAASHMAFILPKLAARSTWPGDQFYEVKGQLGAPECLRRPSSRRLWYHLAHGVSD